MHKAQFVILIDFYIGTKLIQKILIYKYLIDNRINLSVVRETIVLIYISGQYEK
jgi:hypothetical protein